MLKEWSPESEMAYWNRYDDDFYVDWIKQKYDVFEPFLKELPKLESVADVGGGKLGGALYFFKGGTKRYLIDYLADKFEFEPSITPIKADFADIPLPDNSVDILFAWEVLDHARDISHFKAGISELKRICGGYLVFHHIARHTATDGHTVLLTPDEIMDMLVGRDVWKDPTDNTVLFYQEEDFVYNDVNYGKHMYAIMKI